MEIEQLRIFLYGILAIGIVYVIHFIRVSKFKKAHNCKEPYHLPTGLLSLPLLRKALRNKSEGTLAEFAQDLLKDHYSVKLSLGGIVPVVLTKDPENIKALIGTQFNDFALGTRHAHFKPLLGDGIFTLDAQGWKNSRAMLRPQFSREQVAHVKSLEPHIKLLEKHIKKFRGETFDIQELFFRLTMDTATEFLFGSSVETLKDESINEVAEVDFEGRLEFAEGFNVSQAYLASRTYSQVFYFLINNREFREANKVVHKLADYFVDQTLKISPEKLNEKAEGNYTFLYELAKQTRDPKVLRDQALNILLAGRDTTAGLLSFTFLELARNPEIWNKLRKTVLEEFGTGTKEDLESISFETLKKCEYLKFVVNEALRMYPSVPMNFRTSTKETTLPRGGGKDGQSPIYISKGTTVAYSIYTTQRCTDFYGDDAHVFKPERWSNLNKLGWAYLPFNGGPRICLGQQFALTEASYVIVRLCQLFSKIESRDSVYPPKKNIQLTMNHKDGVFITLA
ncbi:cytochrome P450 52A13 [[Candida] jaroonii]|uniref:Cytochrome P450 52A13 n=1 Tax=[Candida] jaroonii TaxID=467808 RepID=A0ACA9YCX3_9ASCO|nr:cytochrome P450 52A13 [[Candida] jaroonii]